MSLLSLRSLCRTQSQLLTTRTSGRRLYTRKSSRKDYVDVHTNYSRQRHAAGNATGYRIVGGIAVSAGVGSAVIMANM